MEIVNPKTSFTWNQPLNINGVSMMGVLEKQGWSFGRAGYLAAKHDGVDPDQYNRASRSVLRPRSKTILDIARSEYKKFLIPDFPHYFIIEPTAVCNRRCPFCTINITNRRGHMHWDNFCKLMEECGKHSVYGISLYQLGEPFLWRHNGFAIHDMVDVAASIGGFEIINLSTNGDVGNMESILGSKLSDLIISIDGMNTETYNENRPSIRPNDNNAFKRTVTHVQSFLKIKHSNKITEPYVRLQIINKSNTRDQVVDFIRYWIDIPGVSDIFIKNLDSMRPWLGNSVVSDSEDKHKATTLENMSCQHLWAIGSMIVDGTFNACCHDALTEMTDGSSILNSSFYDWWHGPYMNKLRNEHINGIFRVPCLECRERDTWLG